MAKEMRLRIELPEREPLTVDVYAPYTTREQVAFERQFRSSWAVVDGAYQEMWQANVEKREVDSAKALRSEWVLFFAWLRLRREGVELPTPFDDFVDVVDYDFVMVDVADPPPADAVDDEAASGGADALDPTQPAAHSAPAP